MRAQEELKVFSHANAVHFKKPTIYTEPPSYVTTDGTGPITNPITPGSGKLVSLDDWNSSRTTQLRTNPHWNGIACPECGKEMYDINPNMVFTMDPPMMSVGCSCGFVGTRFV
jgi:hypothetical protein